MCIRDRLYSWGIYVLVALTALLLIIFGGVTDRLIPLFAIGAFMAFTLSQAGMVMHWKRQDVYKRQVVPGSASYDPATKQYTINSAGYNIWYDRDEFRYLWKKVSGDVSLAGDVTFPDPKGYGDRKVVLVIRQNLDDDSKEAMLGEHGAGMIHLAYRTDKAVFLKDMQYRFGGGLAGLHAKRVGIEKRGDQIAIFVSITGEPMHQFGPPITMHFDGPFYVGIGFCSHLPATVDTAVVSDVVLKNEAGKVE